MFDLLSVALGLHALVGVIIFFGGLCVFGVQAIVHASRDRRPERTRVSNIYIENLYIHVDAAGAQEPSEVDDDARRGRARRQTAPSLGLPAITRQPTKELPQNERPTSARSLEDGSSGISPPSGG